MYEKYILSLFKINEDTVSVQYIRSIFEKGQ